MADGARGSNALGWAVIGFLAGVAVTLGAMTILGPGHGRHQSDAAEETIAPPAPKIAEDVAPRPEPPKPVAPIVSAAPPAANSVDQQVQEDAAAAGMTSRRQQPAETTPN